MSEENPSKRTENPEVEGDETCPPEGPIELPTAAELEDFVKIFTQKAAPIGAPKPESQWTDSVPFDAAEQKKVGPKAPTDDPTTTWTWPLWRSSNALGFNSWSVDGRFTVSSADGCTVDWSRGTISGVLGLGGSWVRRRVTKTTVTRPSARCEGVQEGVLFDIDIEMDIALRISYFRLLNIQNFTVNRWITVWADGSAQWG